MKPLFARYDQNLDRGPAVPDGMGQFQPVHAAGHVDIREKQGDIGPGFQQNNRFIRILGLDRNEPRFLDDFDGKHPKKRFILHDQDDWSGFAGWHPVQ